MTTDTAFHSIFVHIHPTPPSFYNLLSLDHAHLLKSRSKRRLALVLIVVVSYYTIALEREERSFVSLLENICKKVWSKALVVIVYSTVVYEYRTYSRITRVLRTAHQRGNEHVRVRYKYCIQRLENSSNRVWVFIDFVLLPPPLFCLLNPMDSLSPPQLESQYPLEC